MELETVSGCFLRLQSEGTLRKTAAYRKTLKTAKQTQASVFRVDRLDRAEQGQSAEVHRCGKGGWDSRKAMPHIHIPTWPSPQALLHPRPQRSLFTVWTGLRTMTWHRRMTGNEIRNHQEGTTQEQQELVKVLPTLVATDKIREGRVWEEAGWWLGHWGRAGVDVYHNCSSREHSYALDILTLASE